MAWGGQGGRIGPAQEAAHSKVIQSEDSYFQYKVRECDTVTYVIQSYEELSSKPTAHKLSMLSDSELYMQMMYQSNLH